MLLNTCMNANMQLATTRIIPWQFPDCQQIPRHFQVFQTSGHPVLRNATVYQNEDNTCMVPGRNQAQYRYMLIRDSLAFATHAYRTWNCQPSMSARRF